MIRYLVLAMCGLLLIACNNDPDPGVELLYPEPTEQLSGGDGTVFVLGFNAFEMKVPGMSRLNQNLFAVGNSFFEQNWVTAPASTKARDGLGPFFNAKACANCHFKDGRGRAPFNLGEINHGLLIQLSVNGVDNHGDPLPHPMYGAQLQDQAIMGVTPEGQIKINKITVSGKFADGTAYTLEKPAYEFIDLNYGDLDQVQFSPRVAPQMIGLGLLDAISEQDILKYADENDTNQDGISGKAIYVWNMETESYTLGKYGWKSSAPTIKQQSATAFAFDMGLTTNLFPETECPPQVDCDKIINGGTPEISDRALKQVTVYSSTLAVPARRGYDTQEVLRGKEIFKQIDCSKCHVPSYKTRADYYIPQLANQKIYPYTDMLLHDMGEELSDHRPVKGASGKEWRTPPLWGIGYTEEVSGHTRFLHDGRARNLEEAILWHGGEAEDSKTKYLNLIKEDRNKLLAFLNSF